MKRLYLEDLAQESGVSPGYLSQIKHGKRPAIESLRRDVEVTTGETGIVIMRVVIIKPF